MTSSVTFEHVETVDATEDDPSTTEDMNGMEVASHPYVVRPLIVSTPCQQPHQDNCSHSTVTRQWRCDEHETCNTCGRKPFFKWFYLCTEDTSGYAAPIDQTGSLLSDWITEAILEGEYTDDEKETLIEQKLRVLEMSERERRLFEARYKAGYGNGYQCRFPATGLNQHPGPASNTTQLPSRPARCIYRSCYHCDRKLQERTWVSLNAVCDDPNIRPPSAWDLWETPVSDVRVIRNLGLRAPQPPQPPPHSALYAYRASYRRHLKRSARIYITGYESSLDVALLSNLATIEEISEEIETLSTNFCIERDGQPGSAEQALFLESTHKESRILVSSNEDEGDSEGSLYS
ncbi:uncharacterized protein BDV14DRAFT_197040 [Aspergillus stella-maris]|uniref:uncharacterized protein n=1 Tax=Aspergillus stella-maris TaxID=1810926 RepID=UPI003CCCA5F0